MRLLNFHASDGIQLGIKVDAGIIDVPAAATALSITETPASLDAMLANDAAGRASLTALAQRAASELSGNGAAPWLLNESALTFAPCVTAPEKIICVGLNYRKHAAESGMKEPETPILFSKYNNTLAACGEDVPLPGNATQNDYEAELVVVMGRGGKNISESDALDHVLGYCNGNDLSARDLQMLTGQWMLGKTLDKFLPLGPYLVTADEIPDPQNLEMKTWVNGDLRQDSNTGDMIFNVAQLIAYISTIMTLTPGDIISTGTPEGVILGMDPRVWLKPGDEVVIEIGKLGQLRNTLTQG
jgi:2-keto-4-pentenoate hydratase/2-oxohepta-3-ene-1,7-dioic acid hydratase in catechol pathway